MILRRLSLRRRFALYLLVVHLAFASSAIAFLFEHRLWLLAVEAFFALSLTVGLRLLHSVFEPVELIGRGVELMRASDFTTRFNATGQAELDGLIHVYNRMVDQLRMARVRNQEQQLFLERILAVSPAAIVTLDLDGQVSDVNEAAERLLAIDGAAARGRPLAALGAGVARELAALPVGPAQVLSLQGRRRVRCQRLTFIDRGFRREFLLLVELTEELRRSEKSAYEKLIRMMSHEVNNTTGAVGSLLESCLNYRRQISDEDRDDFTHALEVAITRSRHMNQFMRQFADVVRLPQPERRLTTVRDLLEDVHVLLKSELTARRIRWLWEASEEHAPVALDRALMEQVFLNIARNAIEAIGEDGTITVRLGYRGVKPRVSFVDTGAGISPEVAAQLFTPFYTTRDDGQGIGLTVVQEILLAHGFEFSLLNASEDGAGAEFTVLF